MTFTGMDAVTAARAAGFSNADSVTAAAIALAESGGNEKAVGGPNANGTSDYGAWQINSSHTTILASGDRFNLNDNARMAYQVFQAQGFKAWTTYNTGKYKSKLDAVINSTATGSGATSAKGLTDAISGTLGTLADPVGAIKKATGIDGLTDALSKAANDTVTVILVVVLLVLGFVIILRKTAPAKFAVDTAKSATKVGALIA